MSNSESKHDRFKRVATGRVRSVIRAIERLGRLSGPSYQYTDEEIEKVFCALQEKLEKAKALFSARKVEEDKFEL